jgi:hypothetical protein
MLCDRPLISSADLGEQIGKLEAKANLDLSAVSSLIDDIVEVAGFASQVIEIVG